MEYLPSLVPHERERERKRGRKEERLVKKSTLVFRAHSLSKRVSLHHMPNFFVDVINL